MKYNKNQKMLCDDKVELVDNNDDTISFRIRNNL